MLKYGSPANRYLRIQMFGCEGACWFARGTRGNTYGHAAYRHTIGVGAVVKGTGTFQSQSGLQTEYFSSDGPRAVFYGLDGTTPLVSNLTGAGSIVYQPTFSGPDGVSVHTPGFNPFYGTSCATPHIGALVALLRSASPSMIVSTTDLVTLLCQNVVAINGAGWHQNAGYGIPLLGPALAAVAACSEGSYVDPSTLACVACGTGSAPAGSVGASSCTGTPLPTAGTNGGGGGGGGETSSGTRTAAIPSTIWAVVLGFAALLI